MANIKKSAEELIGRTPLMELVNEKKGGGNGCRNSCKAGIF